MKTLLKNGRLIMADTVIENGALLLEDGIITEVEPVSALNAIEIDLGGRFLMPGMIDLHCDALEKEVEPRPGVYFPLDFACAQADRRNCMAGITTVFHALSFAHDELGVRNNQIAASVVRSVNKWQPHGLVDNRVHCRYEISDETGLPILAKLLAEGSLHLVSLMDHTPGQGQFKDMASYRDYLTRTYKKSDNELDLIMARKQAAAKGAFGRAQTLADLAHSKGISIASHDDDSVERIQTMSLLHADISEFPVNLEAAKAAKEKGMFTVFGAPNLLRGQSQSGSIRAIHAIHENVVDCLCADYHPSALIGAIFQLPEQSDLDLAAAVRLVTSNPARAARLADRGEIAVGKRADLITVDFPGDLPQVSRVWSKGVEVLQNVYSHG